MKTHEKLKKLRKEAKLTQDQIASFIEVPRSTYAAAEKHEGCNKKLLDKIAEFYKIDVKELEDDENFIAKRNREIGFTEPTPNILYEPKVNPFDKPDDFDFSVISAKEKQLLKLYRSVGLEERNLIIALAEKLGTK